MTISPADAFRAALVAALIAWPCGAGAQTDAATGAPRQLQAPPPPPPANDSQPPTDANAISVSPLGSIEGAPAGLLDDTNGGLGTYIWSGTPRATIDKLLEALPIASPVYSERELARRLLLTIADAPIGIAPQAFLTARLQELMSAGFVLEASIIAANARVASDPEYARTAADAILFADHAKDACSDATAGRLQYADKFWVELRAYCYASAGDQPALDLTRNVMSVQGMTDPAFETLLDDALKHKTVDPGAIADPTSLDFFLMREAGLPIDPGMAKQLGMPAMIVALDNAKASPEDRAAIAEDVLRAGAVPMSRLIALADAQDFSSDELGDPIDVAASDRVPMPFFAAQSLLRQGATHANDNNAKAGILVYALNSGRRANLLEVAAGLEADVAVSIMPSSSATDPGLMARALLLTDNAEAAARWGDIFDAKNDILGAATFRICLHLAAPAHAPDARAALAQLAQNATQKNPDYKTQEFAVLALGLYDALGEILPPDQKTTLATLSAIKWQGRRPSEQAMAQFDDALKQTGRKGEAILLILNNIGANGTGDLAPDVTVEFVHMLVQEGLPDAARQIATDALLLYEPSPGPPGLPVPPPAPSFTPLHS